MRRAALLVTGIMLGLVLGTALLVPTAGAASKPKVTHLAVTEQSPAVYLTWVNSPSVTGIVIAQDGTTITFDVAISSYGRKDFAVGPHTFSVTPLASTRKGKTHTVDVLVT